MLLINYIGSSGVSTVLSVGSGSESGIVNKIGSRNSKISSSSTTSATSSFSSSSSSKNNVDFDLDTQIVDIGIDFNLVTI
jgi:TRAP-type uncharacterized transport system substrate-binding protein